MPWSPKKIVVPIDLADEPSDAVEAAFEITGSRQNVHVIYIVPGMTDYAAGLLLSGVTDEMRVADAEKALQNRLRRGKYDGVQTTALIGDPGSQIVAFAEKVEADLIVISSHGRQGLHHLLIGSVAERVVRLAKCPVLVIKQPAR